MLASVRDLLLFEKYSSSFLAVHILELSVQETHRLRRCTRCGVRATTSVRGFSRKTGAIRPIMLVNPRKRVATLFSV